MKNTTVDIHRHVIATLLLSKMARYNSSITNYKFLNESVWVPWHQISYTCSDQRSHSVRNNLRCTEYLKWHSKSGSVKLNYYALYATIGHTQADLICLRLLIILSKLK